MDQLVATSHAALARGEKIDRFGPPPFATIGLNPPEVVARMAGFDLVRVLESRVDPVTTRDVFGTLTLRFADEAPAYVIMVRDGVAEVSESAAAEGADLRMDRLAWARFLASFTNPRMMSN